MRRRGAILFIASASAFAWLGCNALLGIESAVFEPDGGADTGASSDGGPLTDGSSKDAAADVVHPCTSTVIDPFNCGACGHDCLGGACMSGVCQPVVLATEPGEPKGIAVDATHVYWTNAITGNVRRVSIAGGAVETIYDGPDGIDLGEGLVRSGADVYFTVNALDGGVYKCPATGCETSGPVPVVAPLASPSYVGLAAGDVLVFSEAQNGGRVGRCSLPCVMGADFVAGAESYPTYVATSTDGVYWSTLLPDELRASLGGGAAVTLATNTPAQELAVSGNEVIVAVRGSGVRAVPLDGGAARRIHDPVTQTERIAVDGPLVYFNDGSQNDGRILRCPIAGCGDAGATMASKQLKPHAIALDKKSIYWTNSGDSVSGSIARVAK